MTSPTLSPAESAPRLREFAERWRDVTANEKAAFHSWFIELCAALGVPAPVPPTDDYRFELAVSVVDRDGVSSTNYIDAWLAGHFALEAKKSASALNDTLLRKAYGQVRNYAAHVPGTPPPYLMVVDVPRTLIVWDRWSGEYGDFAAGRRIELGTLSERPDDIALVQDIFARPEVRDPRGKAQLVTKEIAASLAELSAILESRGLEQERVARFLMRCVFSCFAEDVGLLPANLFRNTLEQSRGSGNPEQIKLALESLWKTMDEGGMYGPQLLVRFNGHFFKSREAIPLEASDVELLIKASRYDWSRVEPSIFGTLLVRALDPEERHRLGAEYTPREYIERLVEPTVVEPIREKWTAVQAAVVQLEERAGPAVTVKKKGRRKSPRDRLIDAALKELLDFHAWMRALRFLDPACGSGNFLYVTMAAVKRIEHEVLNEYARLKGELGLVLDEVHPRQFHGIEVKPWAREIAELTLWIGYHQFWLETHGGRTPPEPVLEDTGTIECRDAVLAWDEIVHRPEKDRPDPTPRIVSPVTGELVPDPEATLRYYEYVGARQAEWPEADFIVGNPPYIGEKRQRDSLGDGYVDALRRAYGADFESSDFVMYWWRHAAKLVASRHVMRAGLITTNSITQSKNRIHITSARINGARVIWAAPDHPWVAEQDGAAVRVALTVLSSIEGGTARRARESEGSQIIVDPHDRGLNDDLSSGANIEAASSVALEGNAGLCWQGFKLVGSGFLLDREEAMRLRAQSPRHDAIVRPWRNGRDLTDRPRDLFAIDFGLRTEDESRQTPMLYDIVRSRVKPERDANRDRGRRLNWWRFGRTNENLRRALVGLSRYIATVEVSKIRFFEFLDVEIAPDGALVLTATDDSLILGVLSSRMHVAWTLAAGGTLEDRPRYNKQRCFDSFPFPHATVAQRDRIAALAERLDAHRKSAIARDERVTMTGMYNVVEKLRSGEPLTKKERAIHEIAACGILRDMHDELDVLVAEAYGWPWPMERDEILERLVALHDERVEEEKRGTVRWLRPEYQIPRFAPEQAPAELALGDGAAPTAARGGRRTTASAAAKAERAPWPTTVVEQIAVLGGLLAQGPRSVEEAASAFTGAKRDHVARHLETLALMGEVSVGEDGRYRSAQKVA